MSEKKTQKNSWFKGMKAEYRKIIWPDQTTVTKQTIAVLFVTTVLGVIISIVDFIAQYGIDLLIK